jgi:5,10-methenyltetrahydrofolate synthetase
MAIEHVPTSEDWNEIKAWRKARRAQLIAARISFAPEQRKRWNERITALLEAGFPVPSGAVIGFCWPYQGEFDARFAVRRWRDRGAIAALPEVIEKAHPLQFREWWPGVVMKSGVYDIPVPSETYVVVPNIAIVPMNGFDERGYRLGYGGGYFDRTLAALERRVLAIGISSEALRLPTIHPQPHDIPMDFVVTEATIYRAGGKRLTPLDTAKCAVDARLFLESRRLPHQRQLSSVTVRPLQGLGGYSSPPCYVHEFSPHYSEDLSMLSPEKLVELLNTLLEAERAGAKTLTAFLDDYERDTAAWRQLVAVQRDEAKNCAILIDLIRRLNGIPSDVTGAFLNKALAVDGRAARLQFLNRGQQWVARKISEALPYVDQGFVRGALFAMQESHLLNIEACDALVETLEV